MRTALREAQALALFSNLAGEKIEHFRHNYAGVFPQNFWDWRIPQLEEGVPILTLDAAHAQAIERLRREPPIPFWQSFQRVLRDAWQLGFPLEECVRLISCAAGADRLQGRTDVEPDLSSFPVQPYQRAVMFLGVEPWRARFCPVCSSRFVADKPGRRFCSAVCSGKARRASKKAWWGEHGEEWRADYEEKKAKNKAKGKRSGRAKR